MIQAATQKSSETETSNCSEQCTKQPRSEAADPNGEEESKEVIR